MFSWLDPDLFAVLTLGLAAPVLGLVALLARTSRRPRPWWGVAAVAFAAPAVGAAVTGQARGFWLPPAALAGVCAALQVLRSEWTGRAVSALLGLARRPVFQAALLVAVGPTLAGAWVVWTTPDLVFWRPPARPALVEETVRLEADPALRLTTDAGRPLALYHPADAPAPPDQLTEADAAVMGSRGLDAGAIRTGPAKQDYNCHGWVFTGGRGWIEGAEVDQILLDNHYYVVARPRPGDLVVYRDAQGAVSHTGVVRAAWAGVTPLVESKWGEGGRFVTAANTTPYGVPVYYRSFRHGHLLRGLGGDEPAGPTLQG